MNLKTKTSHFYFLRDFFPTTSNTYESKDNTILIDKKKKERLKNVNRMNIDIYR